MPAMARRSGRRHDVRAAGARTPSQDVEQNLLDAAEAVLVREGLAGVTVRAVAAEAGVAPMGVYNRFGSKDGLIDALVMRSLRPAAGGGRGARRAGPDRAAARVRGALPRLRAEPPAALHGAMFGAGFAAAVPTDELATGRPRRSVAGRPGRLRDGPGCAAGPVTRSRRPADLELGARRGLPGAGRDVPQVADPAENSEQLLQMLLDGLR